MKLTQPSSQREHEIGRGIAVPFEGRDHAERRERLERRGLGFQLDRAGFAHVTTDFLRPARIT